MRRRKDSCTRRRGGIGARSHRLGRYASVPHKFREQEGGELTVVFELSFSQRRYDDTLSHMRHRRGELAEMLLRYPMGGTVAISTHDRRISGEVNDRGRLEEWQTSGG